MFCQFLQYLSRIEPDPLATDLYGLIYNIKSQDNIRFLKWQWIFISIIWTWIIAQRNLPQLTDQAQTRALKYKSAPTPCCRPHIPPPPPILQNLFLLIPSSGIYSTQYYVGTSSKNKKIIPQIHKIQSQFYNSYLCNMEYITWICPRSHQQQSYILSYI